METFSLCPFCNSDARIAVRELDDRIEMWVECNGCCARGPSVEFHPYIRIGQSQQKQNRESFEQEVGKLWNQRYKNTGV